MLSIGVVVAMLFFFCFIGAHACSVGEQTKAHEAAKAERARIAAQAALMITAQTGLSGQQIWEGLVGSEADSRTESGTSHSNGVPSDESEPADHVTGLEGADLLAVAVANEGVPPSRDPPIRLSASWEETRHFFDNIGIGEDRLRAVWEGVPEPSNPIGRRSQSWFTNNFPECDACQRRLELSFEGSKVQFRLLQRLAFAKLLNSRLADRSHLTSSTDVDVMRHVCNFLPHPFEDAHVLPEVLSLPRPQAQSHRRRGRRYG